MPTAAQKIAEGKTSYELSWKVKVMSKIKNYAKYVEQLFIYIKYRSKKLLYRAFFFFFFFLQYCGASII